MDDVVKRLQARGATFLEREAAAEITRLREALKKIASCKSTFPGDVVDIAQQALKPQV